MEENKKALQITQLLHSIGNTLNVQITELLKEVDWYNDCHLETFFSGEINDDIDYNINDETNDI